MPIIAAMTAFTQKNATCPTWFTAKSTANLSSVPESPNAMAATISPIQVLKKEKTNETRVHLC